MTNCSNNVKLNQSKHAKCQWFRNLSPIIIENMDETKHNSIRTSFNEVKKYQKENFEIKNTLGI